MSLIILTDAQLVLSVLAPTVKSRKQTGPSAVQRCRHSCPAQIPHSTETCDLTVIPRGTTLRSKHPAVADWKRGFTCLVRRELAPFRQRIIRKINVSPQASRLRDISRRSSETSGSTRASSSHLCYSDPVTCPPSVLGSSLITDWVS